MTLAASTPILLLMRLAVLAVALMGCGEVVSAPEPPLEHHPVEDVEIDAPVNAEAAIAIVLRSYQDQTGATTDVGVRWFGQQVEIAGGLATGVCYSCTDIWVWTEPGRKLADTALAHELGHCIRAVVTGGDGDAAHADPAWWGAGGFVEQARQALVANGL